MFAFCNLSAINIPFTDANFKSFLVTNPAINTNGDGEISDMEAAAYQGTSYTNNQSLGFSILSNNTTVLAPQTYSNAMVINSDMITNLDGIQYFTGIKQLFVTGNSVTQINNVQSINISALTNLEVFGYFNKNANSPLKLNLLAFPMTAPNQLKRIFMENSSSQTLGQNIILNWNYLPSLEIVDLRGKLPLSFVGVGTQPYAMSGPALKIVNLDFSYPVEVNKIYGSTLTQYINLNNVNTAEVGINASPQLTYFGIQSMSFPQVPNPLFTLDTQVIFPIGPNNIQYCKINHEKVTVSNPFFFANLMNLKLLDLQKYVLTNVLDLSMLNALDVLNISTNQNYLKKINLKNGRLLQSFTVDQYPNSLMLYVCVAYNDLAAYNANFPKPMTYYTANCNTMPPNPNTITGRVRYDASGTCTSSSVGVADMFVKSSYLSTSRGTFSHKNVNYGVLVPHDQGITTNIVNLPSGLSVSPTSDTWNPMSFNNTKTVNFCLTGTTIDDVGIWTWNCYPIRPVLNHVQNITVRNFSTVSKTVYPNFTYDDAKLDYVSSGYSGISAANGAITFPAGITLDPLETKTYSITFNSTATSLLAGNQVTFTANLGNNYTDAHNPNNSTSRTITAVNSFDPNDKAVEEGSQIYLSQASDYLTYKIRFQNEGTAAAINVVVEDDIDADLDLNSLRILETSHPMNTEIIGNKVRFLFANINLDYKAHSEPASMGYIVYQIKPKTGIAVGDIMTNTANIFFDYNEPIVTNTTSTTVVQNSSMGVSEVSKTDLQIYPNPVTDILNIKTQEKIQKTEIFDLSGRVLLINISSVNQLNISNLKSGNYILKITTNKGATAHKIIKK